MQRIRVLHVIPSFGNGGAERMATHLLLNSDRSRFDVSAASLYDRCGTEVERKLDSAGIQVWYLGKHLGPDLRMLLKLRAVIKQFKPNVVHTHLYALPYVLPAVWMERRIKVIHTVHSIAEKEAEGAGRIIRRLVFRSGAVTPVCIARGVAESVTRLYGIHNAPLIPNGIPVADYANGKPRGAVRATLGLREDEVVFLAVGTLYKPKNHYLLLRSIAEARGRFAAPVCCLIAGDGVLSEELRSAAESLGVNQYVQFLGRRQDIPDLLNAADVFVLSSDREGNPLSLMEAMAAGKAVIATAVGGVPEMFEPGESGLLVPAGSVRSFSEAMLLLAASPELRDRLGRRAAKIAEQRFGVRPMAEAYESLYVLGNSKRWGYESNRTRALAELTKSGGEQ